MSKSEPSDGKRTSQTPLSGLAAQIEAVLFLAASPVSETELKTIFDLTGKEIAAAIRELEEHLALGHGLIVKSLAGGWALETNPYFADVLSTFRDVSQRRHVNLTKAAVETLAIISYNQPVTRGEVEDMRGVRSEGVIERLLSYGLIRISGRKKASGSPLLYRTTPRFLEQFGLDAIADLPTLEELEELTSEPVKAEADTYTEESNSRGGDLSRPEGFIEESEEGFTDET